MHKPIDIDTLDAPALRDLCRQLDAEAQGLWEALALIQRIYERDVSSGHIRAKPRTPVLTPKTPRPAIED